MTNGLSMHSDFSTVGRIVFGDGVLAQIPELIQSMGTRALLVQDASLAEKAECVERLRSMLATASVVVRTISVNGEPRVETIDKAVDESRPLQPEFVISLGGGSVLDTGKALAGLSTNEGSVLEYLEGVGTGKAITRPALPHIAIPTTAGTGSEVTKNSVITGGDGEANGFKKSLRSPYLLPRIALVDPELTRSCPRPVTAACGYDALTQLIESYTSNHSGPITDALAIDGIRKASVALPRLLRDSADVEARRDMALASLFGGMCLANAGLGAVHGMAAALGAVFPIPHGVACALGLAGVLECNAKRLEQTAPGHPCLSKLREACGIVLGDESHTDPVGRACAQIREGLKDAEIPRLGAFGVSEEDLDEIVAKSRGSSMKYNPVELSDEDLKGILEEWI